MKKKLCAVLAMALAGPACAQSSVTLYGIVDTGVSYYNHAAHGGSFVGMPTLTGEVPSRWGLKGTEDLGAGYQAFFVLENGFQPGTGALNYGGRLFGRQANVGVSGGFGALTLGRQMNMTMLVLANADVIGPSIHSMADFDSYLPNARSDNAIGYKGTFHGVTLGTTYSFGRDAAGPAGPSATGCAGQVAGDFVACRQYTAMIAYDTSQFGLAASHDVMRGGAGALAPLNGSGYTDTRDIVAAYVKWGPARLGAGWIRRNLAAARHLQSDIVFAGGTYYATPALAFDVQGVRYLQRGERESGTNGTLVVGRANYFLSKRTTVYTSVGYLFNSAQAANPVAAGGTVGLGMNQLGVMAGIQQKF
ncbi:gram-negative porin family protein [Burkholderia cenocepacia]|uniref:Gram-negative porin family protein n=1 Tax=Burkholderia cenocepacia TaxID=95486 RepID=A0AAN0VPL3_9BURK|nr:gram-negative porin family protein [Burkholderia cenocepacia]